MSDAECRMPVAEDYKLFDLQLATNDGQRTKKNVGFFGKTNVT
ncbi:MAG: hypothetical protein WA584_05670 [Pyrinomonadaceae bacterium]